MRLAIILLLSLTFLTIVTALPETCEEYLDVGFNCTMYTPVITCNDYNYTIFNQTDRVMDGNLTLLNDSIYYFIFNESTGSYIVKLCEDSTREIYVKPEENMILAIIIGLSIFALLFICVGVYLLYNKIR